jgi:mono/diheme cytochrome c family protein
MYTPKKLARGFGAIVASALLAACAATPDNAGTATPARGPNLGATPTPTMLAAMDISIPPSGAGLPAGSGNVAEGQKVYETKCQTCHGPKGAGKPADPLVGGIGSLASGKAMRTVGSYWPYATTLFDYTRRAMPTNAPQTLTNEEVYAVTAYVLHLNGIVPESAVMNAQTLPQVKMPNRDGFIDYSRK